MSDSPQESDVNGTTDVRTAFRSFEDAITVAATAVRSQPKAAGLQNQGRATEYVLKLARAVLEYQLLSLDENGAVLYRHPDQFAVPGEDPPNLPGIYNPDNVSYHMVVAPSAEYEIRGVRGNSADLSFQAISGFPGEGSVGSPTALLPLPDLDIGADGKYTVTVGPKRRVGNWLETVPETSIVVVRETFSDWQTEAYEELHIERVDASGLPLTQLSPSQLASAVRTASDRLALQSEFWDGHYTTMHDRLPANMLSNPPGSTGAHGGMASQMSCRIRFDLADDDTLVVRAPPCTNAGYQGLEVSDVWGQTLPYATHQSSLNATQAELGSDHAFHFVVSLTDPGVPNWIDTVGHNHGMVSMRWQHISGDFTAASHPSATLVKIAALAEVLPPDTPKVTPADRIDQQAVRAQSLARRVSSAPNPAKAILTNYLTQLETLVGSRAFGRLYPKGL